MNCVDTVLFGQVCDNCDGGAILKIISLLVNILSAGLVVAATIGIIIVGAKILTSRDNADVVARAKKRLFEIVIGLVAYSLFYAILNFIIPGGVMTSTLDSSTTSCPEKMSSGSTKSLKELSQIPVNKDKSQQNGGSQQQQQMVDSSMGDIIARTAATYSYPVQASQKDWDRFYDNSKAGQTISEAGLSLIVYGDAQDGKCYNPQYKRWDNYRSPADDCVFKGARASYRYAGTVNHTGPYAYCDRFLSSVIYSLGLQSGGASKNFPVTGPTSQGSWFDSSSYWTEIENHGKDMLNGTAGVEQLKPGDVLQMDQVGEKSGHVAVYVGEYGGSYGKLAEASSSGKFPRITPFLEGAYHKTIGGKNMFALASDRKYHIYRYTGPMTDTAKNSPFNGSVAQQSQEETPAGSGKTFPRQANTYQERAGLSYYLHVPEGATENMPLIIFLHGVGEVKAPSRVANLPQVKALESASASQSFIGIAPVQPDDSYSSQAVFTRTKALIDEIVNYYNINKKRIYVFGFSMGGAHTWCLVDMNPTYFKAAAPISMWTKNSCAGSGPSPGHFTHTKVWAQAGGAETKHVTSMESFVKQINAAGGSAQFSTVGNFDHIGTQKNVDNNAIINWLLAQ